MLQSSPVIPARGSQKKPNQAITLIFCLTHNCQRIMHHVIGFQEFQEIMRKVFLSEIQMAHFRIIRLKAAASSK